MSIVTLQVGQAGCQGGAALLQLLAEAAAPPGGKLSASGEWSEAADRFFYLASTGGQTNPTARAVLLDMEPKVVAAAQQTALQGGAGWQYSRGAALARQSGSGNNWAAGALRHAPAVQQQALGMLRRQVERCDRFAGFLVMQSAAGGTGSGLGSAMTEALKDEFPSSRVLNHCIWPFECGEVATQPYNCMLTLASLAQHSDGVILAENEALSATCQRQLGIQRPDFCHLNDVAARALASILLPCTQRQAPDLSAGSGSAAGGASRGGRKGRPEWDAGGAPKPPLLPPAALAEAGWDGSFGSGGRWDAEDAGSVQQQGSGAGSRLDTIADVCGRLCSRPGYRLLSLRCCPLMPPSSFEFTPFSWPVVLRDLQQMQLAGRSVEAGLASAGSSAGSSGIRTPSLGAGGSRSSASGRLGGNVGGLAGGSSSRAGSNRAVGSLLVLRGDGAKSADVTCFGDPTPYSSTAAAGQPLAVAASSTRLCQQQMLATLLSNDQAAAAPVGRMLGRAAQLYEARAYVHHYERFGLSCSDFEDAFEVVEGVVQRYGDL